MKLGTAQVIRANSRHIPLADNSVDLVVTSPPYFALRSYQDEELCLRCIEAKAEGRNLQEMWPDYAAHAKAEHNRGHYAGQIGDEPTPAEFVDSLIEVTRECMRVLKPSGSLWVNLGDKYNSASRFNRDLEGLGRAADADGRRGSTLPSVATKSLIGIPWRYALCCIDDLGLILRAEVIWSKPNGLPESVTDRVRRSHEQWFHFTLQPRYFSAVDEIREAHAEPGRATTRGHEKPSVKQAAARAEGLAKGSFVGTPATGWSEGERSYNPLGKLPGSVWTVPTEPLRVPDHLGIDHFAAFPTEFPKRIIAGWSPSGVCVECGEGRRPVTDKVSVLRRPGDEYAIGHQDRRVKEQQNRATRPNVLSEHTITGYSCACPESTAPTTPAVVLDPFGGTGTTAMVAKALGRHGVTVDMSADYCRLATWRTNDRNQLAKVLGVEKTDAPDEAQLDLFGGDAA